VKHLDRDGLSGVVELAQHGVFLMIFKALEGFPGVGMAPFDYACYLVEVRFVPLREEFSGFSKAVFFGRWFWRWGRGCIG
jgi:hypothetical protein